MDLNDPTTAYAQAALDGTILVGPYVRLACERHMRMLETQGEFYYWDPAKAQRLIDWFPDMLVVEEGAEKVPFYLLDWQVFVAGSINGWRRAEDGLRLFTEVYVEGAKGCGKSPFAAGLGLFGMLADEELSAQVYSGGARKEQAQILFDDAVAMVDESDVLSGRLVKRGENPTWMLYHRKSRSFFRPLSKSKQKSGIRPHFSLIDELHEHKDRYTVDMLTQTKGRRQPLLFIITNSGYDRKSVCWEWRQTGIGVLENRLQGQHQFFYIMALDPGDDPLNDESVWPKTNPGLDITVTREFLQKQVLAARQIPGRENEVRRLNFCQWTEAESNWMTREAWEAVEADLVDFQKPKPGELTGGGYAIHIEGEGFHGADCDLGLDLAWVNDMAALAFSCPEGDRVCCWIEYFLPLGNHLSDLQERVARDDAPYIDWIRRGLITGIEGPVIRMEHIGRRIGEVMGLLNIRHAAYDRYAHKNLEAIMAEAAVHAPWIEHPQGFRRGGVLRDRAGNPFKDEEGQDYQNPLWMPSSMGGLETRILEHTMEVQVSPVTRWQVSSVVPRKDPAGTGNQVFDKAKSVRRIDGIVALAMSVGTTDAKLPIDDLRPFLMKPVFAR